MPSEHHELRIVLGAAVSANKITAKLGDTFRIDYDGDSMFTFRYNTGFPFETRAALSMHRQGGEEREATKVGVFPFRCFFNGMPIPALDEVTGALVDVAGEIEVVPGP